ncbi:hypothetical protein PoB_001739300 [Plakobranchus ocellatus]|uniref:Uncharacterized protein n=1 Tax=Plakobranchus ocellatus TaxID=259542 RepID=A0AAV3Z827_9GAST|nr:hypothetical protein PoB_001739300 [Plakobranchus ocellatus]
MMKKLRRRLSLTLHSKRGATSTTASAASGIGGVGHSVGRISRSRTLSDEHLDHLAGIAERQLTIDELTNALTEQDEEEDEDTIDLDNLEKLSESKKEKDSQKQLHHQQKEPHHHQHHYYYHHSHQQQHRFRPFSGSGGLHQQQYQSYHHSQPQLSQLRVPSLSSAASLQEGDLGDLTEDSSPLSGSADVLSPFRANGRDKAPAPSFRWKASTNSVEQRYPCRAAISNL